MIVGEQFHQKCVTIVDKETIQKVAMKMRELTAKVITTAVFSPSLFVKGEFSEITAFFERNWQDLRCSTGR